MTIEIFTEEGWVRRLLAEWAIDPDNGGISYLTTSGTNGHSHKNYWRKS